MQNRRGPVSAADRARFNEVSDGRQQVRLDVEGTFNLRDVGNLPVAGGGCIRPHLLYRGDAIDAVTAAGAEALRRLKLHTVVDLRDAAECKLTQPNFGLSADIQRMPILRGRFEYECFGGISDLYTAIIDGAGVELAAAITVLARPNAFPALVHCTAGKDRTGLVIALLLAALDVPDDAVVQDYALTEVNFVGEARAEALRRAAEAGVGAQRLAVLMGSPAEAMRHALAHVRNLAGSVAEYLAAHGVTSGQLQQLRAALVEFTP